MVFDSLEFYDIIIFLGIAVFLIYRLRNVLGKKGGFEKQATNNNVAHENFKANKKTIPQLKDNELKLSTVYEALDDFDHKKFLDGAKFAFETIINAFNRSDKKTLKNLLTKDVYHSFEEAIDKGKNNPNYQFYSLVVDSVEEATVINNTINITLKITSEQFKDNDESTITKKQDTWIFQKDISSKSPIWLLSST
jgi:predicted lipid-binding transport protein (Tim44 family)